MKKYHHTHINKQGMRQLTGTNQGRFFSDTQIEAVTKMREFLLGTTPDSIAQHYGIQAVNTFEVREIDCYETGDARGIYFDTFPPSLKVAADPRFTQPEHSPYHHSRYIVTEDAELEVTWVPPNATASDLHNAEWETVSGSVIAKMTDTQHQAKFARLFAASPDLLEALETMTGEFLTCINFSLNSSPEKFHACLNKAKLALAKARGHEKTI